jgi:DNA adenine methylase
MSQIETILRYPGGKTRLFKYIKEYINPHKIWVDCTWGAGSVSIKKDISEWEIACDINPKIINFYKIVQREYKEISRWISTLQYNKNIFDWAEDYDFLHGTTLEVELAVKTIVRNRLSYDGNMNQYTWSDRLRRNMPEFLSVWEKMPARIIKFGERIKNFYFYVADIERSINLVRDIPDALLYCDLPYKISGQRSTKKLYEIDTIDLTHTRMLDSLQGISCGAIVSHYQDLEYQQKLSHWNYQEIPVKVNMGSKKKKNNRIECIFYK